MRVLFSQSLDPGSRAVRLALAEKGLAAKIVEARPGASASGPLSPELAAANPALTLPVLVDEALSGGEIAIAPESAIVEYLEETWRDPALLPATSAGRAEARRIARWFDTKFENEVNALILRRRIGDGLKARRWGEPEPMRECREALNWHLDYLNYLLERRAWLAGDRLTIADLFAAAHLSACDYIGLIPWAEFHDVRDWYARMKSRPSMRAVLADRIDGAEPPPHYANPDF